MPSSRAILADIEELGLDPTKPHVTISASGHLKHDDIISTEVVDEAPVISGVTECVEQETTKIKQEVVAVKSSVENESSVVEVTIEEGSKKKGKRSSKNVSQ
jgi:hypothetical protein